MKTPNTTRAKPVAADFRGLLQAELTERCRNNPRYSLRSFARSLSVEPSALSQIINGKRPITEKMKLRLGTALGMSVEEMGKLPTCLNTRRQIEIPKFQQITLDGFAIISDWYHYAILELTTLEDFQPDCRWIARRLGITKSEANIAVERLFRMDLLARTPDGRWVDTSENGQLTHIRPGFTSAAARKYQCQLLELSKRAVEEIDLSRRNHTSAAFCFDPADLERAIERIKEFRREFAREFQPKAAKEVYQLQVSLFPLTHPVSVEES